MNFLTRGTVSSFDASSTTMMSNDGTVFRRASTSVSRVPMMLSCSL